MNKVNPNLAQFVHKTHQMPDSMCSRLIEKGFKDNFLSKKEKNAPARGLFFREKDDKLKFSFKGPMGVHFE